MTGFIKKCWRCLNPLFGTRGPVVVVYPGSGTAAMELALRSVVKRGSKVLVLKAGYFGGYLELGVRLLGGKPIVAEAKVGVGFTAEELDRLPEKYRDVEAVALQHVETSTTVANPVRELAKTAKKWSVAVVIDGVASIGGMEMRMDEWGVDVCFTGSKKALAAPPGLAIVAYSVDYASAVEEKGSWSLYFNFSRLLEEMETTRNYYVTPAVNLIYALHISLKNIHEEDLENRFRRHQVMAKAVREALRALGLQLVAKEGFQADTVTAAYLPERVSWQKLYQEMRRRGIEVAGGLGELKGKIFRIGHMGETSYNEVVAVIAALERTLKALDIDIELSQGLAKAQEILSENNV